MAQLFRFLLASIFDLLVILVSYDLITNPKYGFGIYLIFGFFIPFRIIMILTVPEVNWRKKLLLISTSMGVFFLSLYWAKGNQNCILYVILVISLWDLFKDLSAVITIIKKRA